MGYYATFKISAFDVAEGIPASRSFLEALILNGDPIDIYVHKDGTYSLFGGESLKWYEHEEEMVELSKRYPTMVFILDGDGEEQGDIWRKFFLNGKMHEWRQEEVYRPPFDQSILRKLNGLNF